MTAAVIMGFLLILAGYRPMGKGLVLGAFFSILNFILMSHLLPYNMGKSGKAAYASSLFSVLGRYVVLSVPIILAIRMDSFDIATTVVGLFMVQIIILLDRFRKGRTPDYRQHTG